MEREAEDKLMHKQFENHTERLLATYAYEGVSFTFRMNGYTKVSFPTAEGPVICITFSTPLAALHFLENHITISTEED